MLELLRLYVFSSIWGLLTTAVFTEIFLGLMKAFCKQSENHSRSAKTSACCRQCTREMIQQTHARLDSLDGCRTKEEKDREYAAIAKKIEDLMKDFEEKVSEQARNEFLETANLVKQKYGRGHQNFKILKSNWVTVKEKLVMESLRY